MGRRTIRTVGILALGGLLILALVAANRSWAAEQKPLVNLKIHASVSGTSPYGKRMNVFVERVAERTGGKVKMLNFPGGQLGNDNQAMESMNLGTIAGAYQFTSGYPAWDLLLSLYLFRDRDHMWKVMRGPTGKRLIEAFEKAKNIKVVSMFYFAEAHMALTKPVRTLADFKGLKIRVPPLPSMLAGFKALGSSAIPMAFTEVYTAMKQGTIDGLENPYDVLISSGYHEIAKYLVLSGHRMGVLEFMMARPVWDQMTPETQAIVLEEAQKAADDIEREILENEKQYIETFKKAGVEMIQPDVAAFRNAVKDVWKEFMPRLWPAGLYEEMQAVR